MWKLLIVDDEYIVRQGLRQSLPWDEMGIIIAGEAENASDAVKTAKEIYPDIVLCDIRLPGGEGFSVIPRIQTIVPWVQFIMITAYSDKDYMMKAIHNQVCDYLFKPAGLNEIRQAVNRAQEKILIYQEKAKQDMEHRSFLLENMEALREHAVNNLLNGDYNMQKFYQDRKLLKLSLSGPAYRLVLLKEDHSRFYDLMQRLAPLASYALTASKVSGETSLIALILNCSEQDTLTEADLNSILPGIPLKVSKLLHYLSDLPG